MTIAGVGVKPIAVPSLPKPAGHYSPAVRAGGMVFVSGQLGGRPDGRSTAGEAFEVQARQTLENLFTVLAAAGCGRQHVAKVTVYIADMAQWGAFNQIYAELFGEHRPARAVVPVGPLNHGYLVEVEAIAVAASDSG
jgi:2-iminobutanoate/2-iminopropanoate deaminase